MTAPRVLVCGSPDRGDDAAALLAAEGVSPAALAAADIRVVGELTVEALIEAAAAGRVLVLDAATGVAPGTVVELPFAALTTGSATAHVRSSHELPIPEVVGLAELMLGRPLEGGVVALGGAAFGYGLGLSERVRAALPAFVAAIEAAVRA